MKCLAPVVLAAIQKAGALESLKLRLIRSAHEQAPVKKNVIDSIVQFLQMGT